MNLTQETIKRIEDEAKEVFSIHNVNKFDKIALREIQSYHFAKQQGYIAGATAEAERAAIVEAEKDKKIAALNRLLKISNDEKATKIANDFLYQQLTTERDAYKAELFRLYKKYGYHSIQEVIGQFSPPKIQ